MTVFTLSAHAAFARIEARNATLCAYINTRLPEARAEADARAAHPPRSPLHGVPFGVKDEFDTKALYTTGGSHRHKTRLPSADSPVVAAFDAAGAILVGKSNMSDMGLAPEAASFVGGPVRNPHDLSRTAGGSSGGSAAAVADGMAAFEWGADIGGSIRLPAAFCGVLGMRLSSETWPVGSGFFPMPPDGLAWMCGQGPFTRTVAQMREVLRVAAPALRVGPARAFEPRGVYIYEPDELGAWPSFRSDVMPHLRAAFESDPRLDHELLPTTRARNIYSSVWASHFEDILGVDETIRVGEGLLAVLSSVLLRGRLGDQRFYPNTAELLLLIAIGRYTLYRDRAAALRDALHVKELASALWDRGYVIAAPVCAFPPPIIGRSNYNGHLLSCTVTGNLADATGLAIPFGAFEGRLPRAIQLLGPPGSEDALLEVAERLIASRDKHPELGKHASA
jgi:Asp-tRNA(Asn)/Glu-tRNA(Gln) amidotransferase A subunit family amidase